LSSTGFKRIMGGHLSTKLPEALCFRIHGNGFDLRILACGINRFPSKHRKSLKRV